MQFTDFGAAVKSPSRLRANMEISAVAKKAWDAPADKPGCPAPAWYR